MKSQDEIVAARSADWRELETLVSRAEALHHLDGPSISRAAALYRALSGDLVLCRARCTPDLVAYLDNLAGRAHSALYGAEPFPLPAFGAFLTREFPRVLRKNASFFALAAALFLIPCAMGIVLALLVPDAASQILPRSMLDGMADMYSKGFDEGRGEGADSAMAGFYVRNNVGIAFRCFATGIFFGLGSVFYLIYNGLNIGMVTGWVTAAGFGRNIGTFMCGHGPFELTAIVVAGAAGLRMGHSLVVTHGRTRLGSLRESAPDIVCLVVGAAVMLLIAAAIEGFWSPSAAPPPVKWAVAALFSLLVTAYFVFAGRERGQAP
ncbi:stage II sporulation protein M [Polyangium sorediatum]|uniref:Stage II sporulation protein M n=1 Tax=Polyangium sorediatum TaxID=889274 RepID=A0ABT6NMG7_9BACT|nr:stage II sporulation protein M [Polyangium sorediatum]MDI1429395.1 stage II sporulation protein M [Polyangium sorediatum]